MVRFALLACLAACAHGVSEPNPPTPPPHKDVPYTGRFALATDALRDQVDGFASAWTRRLAIMGLTSKITYDDNRAVFDIYGVSPAQLGPIAAKLADFGGFMLDGYFVDGALITWLQPDAACGCSGRIRVRFSDAVMCSLATRTTAVAGRDGHATPVVTRAFWRTEASPRYLDSPPGPGCNGETNASPRWWIDNIVIDLPLGATPEANLALVLGLAGGTLPAQVAIQDGAR